MTLTLHWWMVPIALVIVALFVWAHGASEGGIMGGFWQFIVGCALIVAAIAVTLTKLVFG